MQAIRILFPTLKLVLMLHKSNIFNIQQTDEKNTKSCYSFLIFCFVIYNWIWHKLNCFHSYKTCIMYYFCEIIKFQIKVKVLEKRRRKLHCNGANNANCNLFGRKLIIISFEFPHFPPNFPKIMETFSTTKYVKYWEIFYKMLYLCQCLS